MAGVRSVPFAVILGVIVMVPATVPIESMADVGLAVPHCGTVNITVEPVPGETNWML